jgi:hypothetical protein
MMSTGCWMGGLNFTPLLRADPEPRRDSSVDS